MVRLNLWDCSDAYINVKKTIKVPNTGTVAAPDNRNKKVIFKNCAPFINCLNKRNNTQVDYAHESDLVMPMYNSIEYSDTYLKTLGSLWQYYRDEPAFGDNGNIIAFPADKNKI